MNEDPNKKWYQVMSAEQWKEYHRNALAAHHANPQDAEALAAIDQASKALSAYDQEGVEQSKLSSIPGELGSVGNGMLDAIKGMPAGIGQMVHHARDGDLVGVAEDIGQGLAATGKGALAPWELALRELSGETVNDSERHQLLHDAGGSLVGLEAMELPGQIGRSMKAVKGAGGSFSKGIVRPNITEPVIKPVDVSKLGEEDFMNEYRKGTMTPDQMDPYGLNDAGGTATKSPSGFPKKEPPFYDAMHPLHDILSSEQYNKGAKPLHPEDVNDILAGKDAQPLSPADIDKILEDITTKPKTPKSKASKGSPPKEPVYSGPVKDGPPPEPLPDSPSSMPYSMFIPGKLGKLAKMLSVLPDATAIRNKALTHALQAVTVSGMKPDSTYNAK